MKTRISLLVILALAFMLPVATMILAQQAGAGNGAPPRPQGPCDVYAAAETPCVAAHSSTRALYAAYNGPLYQVMRQSDGKMLDIGVVQPSATPVPDGGGYADAAAQDDFCANTTCWITKLYDQSGHGNNLVQPPHGGFSGPAMGGFDNLPIADMAPITILGHKAYGVFIEPGMGLRWNNAKGTAVDDQAEGQYWVINGHHYNNGCCFDYGNAETDSRDDGDGTMETTYYGNSTGWYHGPGQGPWVMTDQENNLTGCVNATPNDKNCPGLPTITWRFVTAMAKGEPHHWTSMGGDAQKGPLQVMFDGTRIKNNNNSYDPMRKQGAILLGNGGDNSNGSAGTFYEGAMTAAGTFPTDATDQKVQANVVAAGYGVQRVSVTPAPATATPPGLQTFSPGSSVETAVTFTNTSAAPVTGVRLSLAVPAGWSAMGADGAGNEKMFADPVAPGASVSATFKVTAGMTAFNGDLVGNVYWTHAGGQMQSEKMAEKVRNVSPIKINEFTNSFVELYNAGASEVDLSNWTVTQHPTQQAIFSSMKIPAGTMLAAKGFYLLGLSDSGLAVPAKKGDTTLYVRSNAGMTVGDTIEIDTGAGVETRKITEIGSAAGNATTLWQPLPEGPVITIPVGSKSVPVSSVNGFAVGEKVGLGYGNSGPAVAKDLEKYEVVTVTALGRAGAQTALAANARAGDSTIRLRNSASVSVGDKITLDIDSVDHGTEVVTIAGLGAPAAGGGGGGRGGRGGGGGAALELAAPLKFNHAANIPVSVWGTGITFEPVTSVVHASNEPVQPLGAGIKIDKPLDNDHDINAAVHDGAVTAAGYQGTAKPNYWFGGPVLANAGTIVLRDSGGLVADSLNFGGLIDPWAAEGYQLVAGANRSGCSVPSPNGGGRGGRGGAPAGGGPRSSGRPADGVDTDSNCTDFRVLTPTPGAANQ